MKHLGDITKISGYDVPIVDCVIGGSPCQDLSVAGKRAGLDGERSGLFMEQIRIVKEMREQDAKDGRSDVDVRPRYMVWENVPGALSSGKPKGEDFRIVLEEIARVKDKNAAIPRPDKWSTSGCIMGDGWSIAWRILDAQFWGTSDKPLPQRRRRIALVADFGGQSAPEILFVRKSVSGNTQPGEPKRKAASVDSAKGVGADDREGECYGFPLGFRPENTRLHDEMGTTLCVGTRAGFCNGVVTLDRAAFNQGKNAQFGFDAYQHHGYRQSDIIGTLTAGQNNSVRGDTPFVVQEAIGFDGYNQNLTGDKTMTLTAKSADPHHLPCVVCYGIGSYDSNAMKSDNPHSGIYVADTSRTLDLNCGNPACNQGGIAVVQKAVAIGNGQANQGISEEVVGTLNCMHDQQAVLVRTKHRYIVRRLTPLECERLQGFPDGWTDIGEWVDSNGKKHQTSDAARYKALGNSISLPNWKFVLKRLCACYERDATMASLFDGIGGFPYLWEQLNGKGSCLWASEIEEFPMAVTKVRIG